MITTFEISKYQVVGVLSPGQQQSVERSDISRLSITLRTLDAVERYSAVNPVVLVPKYTLSMSSTVEKRPDGNGSSILDQGELPIHSAPPAPSANGDTPPPDGGLWAWLSGAFVPSSTKTHHRCSFLTLKPVMSGFFVIMNTW